MTTDSTVKRLDDVSGDSFATRDKESGAKAQGMYLDPEIQGDLLTSGATNATELAQESVKAVAGRIFRADVVLIAAGSAGDRWLMLVDKAAAAIDGDLPLKRSPKLVGDFASMDFGVYGVLCSRGIQLVLSTSPSDVRLAPAEGLFQWDVA